MTSVRAAKESLLRDAGFTYNFDRLIYLNRARRKAFSIEWLEDHSEQELRASIAAPNGSDKWQIFFNEKPSDNVLREFLAEVG